MRRQRRKADVFPSLQKIEAKVAKVFSEKGWKDMIPIIASYAHTECTIPSRYDIGREVEVFTKSVGRNIERWRRGTITNFKLSKTGKLQALVTYIDGVKTTKPFPLPVVQIIFKRSSDV
eukprot:jgi/Bigna1/88894/estExt_fgenesh1_pg.C_400021